MRRTIPSRSEEHTSELQSPVHLVDCYRFPTRRSSDLGNVQLWGLLGVQKEAVLAASRCLVTVEQIVDELTPLPGAIVLPTWVLTAVTEVPGGAHPSYAQDYSEQIGRAHV